MLTNKQIEEFQILYQKHFGIKISSERALEEGLKLVSLIAIINKVNLKK